MKKVFKTKKFCRNLANVVRVTLIILFWVIAIYTVIIYSTNQTDAKNPQFTDGNLKVIMIDVGNGDCFLVLQNNKAMLIDNGFFSTYSNVEKVLEENNVKKIDYAILTHLHPDHVGGTYLLFMNYRIDNLYMLERMENVDMSLSDKLFYYPTRAMIKYNNLFANNIIDVKVGESDYDFQFSDSQVQFLEPLNNNYEKINDYSLVFKLTYGENKILFAADMEMLTENELLDANVDVSADVLKIGHHGSNTSSSEDFLDSVAPKFAIVSSDNGNHNRYGHPVKRIVEYLEKKNIPLYRTDELGNVEFECDGENINFVQEPGDYKSGTQFLQEKMDQKRM